MRALVVVAIFLAASCAHAADAITDSGRCPADHPHAITMHFKDVRGTTSAPSCHDRSCVRSVFVHPTFCMSDEEYLQHLRNHSE